VVAAALFSAAFARGQVACAQASASGFAVGRFEPSERGSDWFAADSLDLRGHLRPTVGMTLDATPKSLVHVDDSGKPLAPLVGTMALAHLGASLALYDRMRVGVSVPLQLYAEGSSATVRGVRYEAPPSDQGMGDARLAVHVRAIGAYASPFSLAGGVRVWLPTGSQAQYLGDGSPRARPQVLVAGEVGHFAYAAEAGVTFRHRDAPIGSAPVGPELGGTAAAGATFASRRVFVGPELYFSTVLEDAFRRTTTPLEAALGAHVLLAGALRVGAAMGAGLTRGQGTPPFRVVVALEWLVPSFDASSSEGSAK